MSTRWIKRTLAGVVAFVIAVGLVILGMFGYLQFESRRAVTLPAPPGPYAVGRAGYQWTDVQRRDPFSPHASSPVELPVWVWYPASVPRDARRASYLPPKWAQSSDTFLQTRAEAVTAHAWADAPVAGTRTRFPVLVFMPGFGKVAGNYTTLLEDLASRGYVVFAISPPYISDDVVLNGRLVPENRPLHAALEDGNSSRSQQASTETIAVEADDIRFTLDRALALGQAPTGRFAHRLAAAPAGFLGHSIGGAAALQACQSDAACAGAANLDGSMAGPVVTQGVHKPFLYLGEDPSTTPLPRQQLRGVAQGLPSRDVHVFTMSGAGHMNFSDLGVLWNFPPGGLGTIGSIAGARALSITQTYLSSFFASELEGQPSALLSSSPPPYPEVRAARGITS